MTSKLIEVTLQDGGTREALARLQGATDNLSPAMREISEILYAVTMRNFDLGGQPGWAPLRPATIRARSKDGTWPGKMLQRSGVLMASVHPFSTRDAAVISAATPYAEIQQRGGTIERGAGSGSIRLRTKANGDLVRQGGLGRKRNLAVFAKATHKRAKSVDFETAAHSIDIPARPFLPVTADDELQPEAEKGILDALNTYLGEAWDG